jgi:methionyl-tRNA synthetase
LRHESSYLNVVDSFGNFVNRALKFIQAKYDGVLPDGGDAPGPISLDDEDADFVKEINELLRTFIESMDAVKIRHGLQTLMLLSARGNLYLQQAGLGNALLADKPQRCAQVLSRAANLIYMLSAAAFPFMPSTSESILTQLNAPARVIHAHLSHDLLAGHNIGTPEHLFKKIDEKSAEVWKARFGSSEQPAPAEQQPNGAAKPLSKKQLEKERKEHSKALAAARAKDAGPKSPLILVLEEKIKTQGDAVRKLKTEKASTEAIQEAVAQLTKLKLDLQAAV